MSLRVRTNLPRLLVRGKGQKNECRPHIRERIASLANSVCGRLRLRPVSSFSN